MANLTDPEAVVDALEDLLAAPATDHALFLAQGGALVARLRQFNRNANQNTKLFRQQTADARSSMDQTHLGLQNLLYEKRHLEREIQKCRESEFMYEELNIHPLEEFIQLSPNNSLIDDEHQLMKNRLDFEFTERTRLEEKKKQLTVERDRLLREKKEHRLKVENQAREEAEFAKKAAVLDTVLSELTLSAGASSPAPFAMA